jgi:hypothetical protein
VHAALVAEVKQELAGCAIYATMLSADRGLAGGAERCLAKFGVAHGPGGQVRTGRELSRTTFEKKKERRRETRAACGTNDSNDKGGGLYFVAAAHFSSQQCLFRSFSLSLYIRFRLSLTARVLSSFFLLLQAFLDTPAIVARAAAPRYGAEAYAHAGGAGRAAVSRRAQRDVAASAQHAMEEEVRVPRARAAASAWARCCACAPS